MKIQTRYLPLIVCTVLFNASALFAQQAASKPMLPAQNYPANVSTNEALTGEVAELRKSLESINTILSNISEKLGTTDLKQTLESVAKQNRMLLNLDILTRTEQRAETLRKQLIELTEKENSLKARLAQVEEDVRPESIDRNINVMGTTRAPEMRETRRRYLENERNSLQNLIQQVYQNRIRLENDVQQADTLVNRLRQRLLPRIEREIEGVNVQ